LRDLRERYGIHRVCATDNIMDFRYFDTFLPALRQANLDLELQYELKTNLSRHQVRSLVDAGLTDAQTGIETLSTPLLRLMCKGVTALQNLQTLKWLSEAGVDIKWNFLYGFPHEDPGDYAALPGLFAALTHLVPPQASGRIRFDRFSPYFEFPQQYGLSPLHPITAYQYIYPFPPGTLSRLAYYFQDVATQRDPTPDYVQPALRMLEQWRTCHPGATLRQSNHPDGSLVVLDTRPGAERFQRRLTGVERAIYLFCDSGQSMARIMEHVRRTLAVRPPSPAAIEQLLDQWISDRMMVKSDGRYLSLALWTPDGACAEPREEVNSTEQAATSEENDDR
jgi:ribosomal peptide maturation radical SAM protein 1